MGRLLFGGEVLRDPDIGASGHADLARGVRPRAEVLHELVAIALLARREEVAFEISLAPARAAHVCDRTDHAAGREEVWREAATHAVSAIGSHSQHDREPPRQPGPP